jgi:RimJ/RimL family protein N-acetyltransferase
MQFENDAVITAFHAAALGCPADVFFRPGTTVVRSESMAQRKRVIAYRTDAHTVILAAPEHASRFEAFDPAHAADADAITRQMPALTFKWLDPVYHLPAGYADAPADPRARQLSPADGAQLDALNGALSEDERKLGSVSIEDPLVVGVFVDERCLSAASFLYKGEQIADIGVLVHPDARGRGLGRIAVQQLLRHRGARIAHYTTQDSNLASQRVAASVGFRRFMTEIGFAYS